MNSHLVILKKPYLDSILRGDKTIELRLTKGKTPEFGHILPGDTLFLKISAGPVCATAEVAEVEYHPRLRPEQIVALRNRYGDQIGGSDAVWQSKMDCKCGFLVWMTAVRPIEPTRIEKRDWRAWVVLTKEKNFGLLSMRAPAEGGQA